MLKLWGLVMMLFLVVVVAVGAPNILAQSPAISNYSSIVSDIKNDTINMEIQAMIANCSGSDKRYNDLYSGLKETQYGEELKTQAAICDHNVLYYYGICEQVQGQNVIKTEEMTLDCGLAYLYLKDNGLLNQTRPQNFVFHPDITH
jgi:hypothetical protein